MTPQLQQTTEMNGYMVTVAATMAVTDRRSSYLVLENTLLASYLSIYLWMYV